MSKKKDFEAIALVIDTGVCSIKGDEHSDFLEKCKECAKNIILKKIFAESQDVISLILFGSESTSNPLSGDGQYENIAVEMPFMRASWDLISAVSNINQTTVNSDWLDAVVVAMQCLKEKMDATKDLKNANHITTAKLVLFSTFRQNVIDDQVSDIVGALIDTDIELICIGPDQLMKKIDMCGEGSDIDKLDLIDGEEILKSIIDKTGSLVAVSEAVCKLAKFTRKKTGRQRWISNLYIGRKITLPVNGYKIMNELPLKTELRCVEDNAPLKRDCNYFHGNYPVDREDIIKGYIYADAIVPLSKLDLEAMNYLPGDKGIHLIGFVKKDAILRHFWSGKSGFYVVGDSNDPAAQSAMTALVEALQEMGLVGLARKVNFNNRGLKIGALYPKVDVNPPALIFIELPFAEEMRCLQFPSLNKTQVSEEQYDIIDKLIDSMDLSAIKEDENEELYDFSNLVDIKDQVFMHALAKRGILESEKSSGLNFDAPAFLKEMLQPDPIIQENSKDVLMELKELFPLKPVLKKVKSDNAQENEEPPAVIKSETDENEMDVSDFFQTSATAVGSVTPVEDFLMLFKKQEDNFDSLCEQIQTIIIDLLIRATGVEMYEKPTSALKCLRKTCIEMKKSADYNSWLQELKKTVIGRDLRDFWNILVKECLGLITQEEMPYSFISRAEGEEFLDYSLPVQKLENADEEIDYDAMLMEM